MTLLESVSLRVVGLPAPRRGRRRDRPLLNALSIALCAAPGGGGAWAVAGVFAQEREDLLAQSLDMSGGVPSHDAFGRPFSGRASERFRHRFVSWPRARAELTNGEVVAPDGEATRGSFDAAAGAKALPIASA